MLSVGRALEDPDNLADTHPYNGAGAGYGTAADGTTVQEASGRGCFNPERIAEDTAAGAANPNFQRRGNGHYGDEIGGRTLCVSAPREPDSDGQFGISLSHFAEWANDTEFRFYHLNYHSRLPIAGFYAADANSGSTGLPTGAGDIIASVSGANPLAASDDVATLLDAFNKADTASIVLDYPENLRMWGFSFNTTLGSLSVAGEYAYHENRPLQLDTTDLTMFAVAPAFGRLRRNNPNVYLVNNTPTSGQVNPPLGDDAPGIGAVPSFVELHRGGTDDPDENGGQPINLNPGEFVKGHERFPVGQGDVVILSAVSANPFFADQWIRVFEIGFTKVFGMPDIVLNDQLQPVSGLVFAGPGYNQHPTLGRNDILNGAPNGEGGTYADQFLIPAVGLGGTTVDEGVDASAIVQNTNSTQEGLPTSFSWGLRHISIFEYNNLFWDINVRPIVGFFWDINGTSPGPGGNHIEGRKTIIFGSDFERGAIAANLTYTAHTGGGQFNEIRDRDSLSLSLKYQF